MHMMQRRELFGRTKQALKYVSCKAFWLLSVLHFKRPAIGKEMLLALGRIYVHACKRLFLGCGMYAYTDLLECSLLRGVSIFVGRELSYRTFGELAECHACMLAVYTGRSLETAAHGFIFAGAGLLEYPWNIRS